MRTAAVVAAQGVGVGGRCGGWAGGGGCGGGVEGAAGAGVQERDPDRRVRQGAARGGGGSARGDAGGVPTATEADHHDVVCVHFGGGAAGAGGGCGGGDAADAGDGGVRGHAGCDAVRH